MEIELKSFTPAEQATFRLRALYEQAGYRKYRASRFEEYALYQEYQRFLPDSQVITFTDLDGKLRAIKPDVTLSIAKTAQPAAGECKRFYYNEEVCRPSRESHTFQTIHQMGLESMGAVDADEQAAVVRLALQSLAALEVPTVLEISHMGYLTALLDALAVPAEARGKILDFLRAKNAHELRTAALDAGLDASAAEALTGPGLAVGFAGGVLAMNGTNFTDLAAGNTTGISGGFLAALLAGFAAGYIVQFLKKITEKLPASLNGIRPMLIYPLGGILIVGAMMCAVNPVMGMINTAMTDWLNALGGSSKVLLGAIVAGMMSVDMGGPVNKAAYVFGTAALASGNYEVMAAVMVGGMVPPIAIALSTTFCPRKWTPDERRNGIVNYVMGLCFVSEGAIPYAAADPLRVLPSCVVGSAVAGALSMTFGCALRAPHGGIFVFPVVDHAALYCVALAVGSVLGAVILSLVKKTQPAEAK
mgnify:CR=1 FL=1